MAAAFGLKILENSLCSGRILLVDLEVRYGDKFQARDRDNMSTVAATIMTRMMTASAAAITTTSTKLASDKLDTSTTKPIRAACPGQFL